MLTLYHWQISMAKYTIEQYQTYVQRYTVEAKNKVEAMQRVLNDDTTGESIKEEGQAEYHCVNEDVGISVESYRDDLSENFCDIQRLANKLDYIPSIRSVTLLPPE